jgi:hypothetical protein
MKKGGHVSIYIAFNGQRQEIPNLEHDRQDVEITELKRVAKPIDKTIPSMGFRKKKQYQKTVSLSL